MELAPLCDEVLCRNWHKGKCRSCKERGKSNAFMQFILNVTGPSAFATSTAAS
eukprot:CAMPEP_0172713916 /NCGR_PEP_ID=MMETSP1074-20121228/64112_1 /TAXON_ID=2916 /ORGANISM="Ceratium fusus, Strain PA161109" /LENGTH=52 /DNA_ID=CAMNT_0013538163 /DNA_START=132 /DNA_END=288 /DNA_ORIENTATION=-